MTDDILKELITLSRNLQRLTEAIAPTTAPDVFDEVGACRVYSQNNVLMVKKIEHPDPVTFRELRGIDDIISGLKDNTEQFLKSLPCNNVLLYGPRGTGKSSAVKAIFNEYRRKGLRMIEMQRDSLLHILEVAEMLVGHKEKFIVYCDDLSFEEDERSYRQIKTVLEGGLETRPANLLIYATSNRRHLMPEKTAENIPVFDGGELHPDEAVEEKLSLSDRFGLRFGFPRFVADTYLEIIENYATLKKIRLPKKELQKEAMQWSLSHGSYSGRTARQFIDDLEGRAKLRKSSRSSRLR
jgi:predicted AAA+ superfamily ATPase